MPPVLAGLIKYCLATANPLKREDIKPFQTDKFCTNSDVNMATVEVSRTPGIAPQLIPKSEQDKAALKPKNAVLSTVEKLLENNDFRSINALILDKLGMACFMRGVKPKEYKDFVKDAGQIIEMLFEKGKLGIIDMRVDSEMQHSKLRNRYNLLRDLDAKRSKNLMTNGVGQVLRQAV